MSDEIELKKQQMLLEDELKQTVEQSATLSEALHEYKQSMESKKTRIAGMEQRILQIERENKRLKSPSKKKGRLIVTRRSSIISMIGKVFLILAIVLLFLHFTGFLRITDIFDQFDTLVRRVFLYLGKIRN